MAKVGHVARRANLKWDISNPYTDVDWSSVHQVKAALHTHTINTNVPIGEHKDGVSGTPATRIHAYEREGFGAVAITEHDYVSYPWSDYGIAHSNLISIPGNELSKNAHLLSYFNTYYDRKGEGPKSTNGLVQNIVNVGELGGFLYLAHPSRGSSTRDPNYVLSLLKYPQVVGIEVLNAGQYTRNHSEHLWDCLLTQTMPQRNIWGTASDDSHTDDPFVTSSQGASLGTGWTYLLLDNLSQSDARSAMINGRTYFSSYRVIKGVDDAKDKPSLPAPTIRSISVDNESGFIRLDTASATKIEWISEHGSIIASGNEVNVNRAPGAAKYIRARMFGPGGQTMTQPFGLQDPRGHR